MKIALLFALISTSSFAEIVPDINPHLEERSIEEQRKAERETMALIKQIEEEMHKEAKMKIEQYRRSASQSRN